MPVTGNNLPYTFTPKAVLVPSAFFSPEGARAALEDVVSLEPEDVVEYVEEPEYGAVMVYSIPFGGEEGSGLLPELHHVLGDLSRCAEYNKIVCSWGFGHLYMAVARGRNLLLCNVFEARDFTTAEYFIFLALSKLQLNPELSTIAFRTPLAPEQEMSLYRYFKAVEQF